MKRKFSALIVAAMLVAGCAPPHVPPPLPPPTHVDVSAALLAIYTDAAVRSDSAPSPDTPLMFLPTVDQAAGVIKSQANTPAGETRRRRVIAKLAAVDLAYYATALCEIGVNADLREAISAVIAEHPESALTTKEVAVYERVNEFLGPLRWCLATYPITWVTDWDHTPKATVYYMMRRRPRSIAIATDPQNWSRCSILFSQSYVARPPATTPTCSSTDPFQGSQPPAPGSGWSGTLFEHAVMWTGAWFKNYLNITGRSATVASTTIRGYGYNLNAAVCSKIFREQNGGLLKDEGELDIWPSREPNWSDVHATKAVRFSPRHDLGPRTLEAITVGMLWMMGYESVDMACCSI